MKKLLLILSLVLILASGVIVEANMAAPDTSDIASGITFKENNSISVVEETIAIRVKDDKAQIDVNYKMKNETDTRVVTESMFLSPNIDTAMTVVKIDGIEVKYTYERYALYDADVTLEDWQYVVLSKEDSNNISNRTVDTILFIMELEAQSQINVQLSYLYTLGGRPNYDYNVRYGEIVYYLTPAKMWNEFYNLSIDIYLDVDMPLLKSSNLKFIKVEKRHYRYTATKLPEENLKVIIDQNAWQNFWSRFKSPYLIWEILLLSPFIILIILVVIVVVFTIHKHKKKKQ